MTANLLEQRAREWLIHGGGGHEDGEDGLRALTVYGEGLIEFLAAYEEYLTPRVQAEARLALLREMAAEECPACKDGAELFRDEQSGEWAHERPGLPNFLCEAPEIIVERLAALDQAALSICPDCHHSLKDNSHGFDQNDGVMEGDKLIHSGRCTYCRICNSEIFTLHPEKERE